LLFIGPAPPTAAICPLSLHDALPISRSAPFGLEELRNSPSANAAVTPRSTPADWNPESAAGLAVIAESAESCNVASAPPTDIARDRKSTRLNSSHVKISYAVFCLKKK